MPGTNEIILEINKHPNEERTFVQFEWEPRLHQIIQHIPGAKWSHSKKQWHLPSTTMIYTHVSSKKIGEIKSPFDDLEL